MMWRGIATAVGLGLFMPVPVSAASLEDSLAKLTPEFRSHQACIVRGLPAVRKEAALRRADRMKTSIFRPAVLDGTKLTATGGAEGIELVRRSRPDIVLLDLLMPGLDGFTVAEQLRADPELAEIPIIVMTAKDLSRADRARLRGTVEHLVPKGSLPHAELARLVERTGRRPSNPLQETS